MNAKTILDELERLGNAGYRRILFNHGATAPCFGVKVSELKKIEQRVGIDHALALALFDTGNYDAMYLAGLIVDDAQMTRKDLQRWATKASLPLAGSTVAWVAAESPHGWELALEWIDAKAPLVAAAGWATLSSLVSIKPDAELDLAELKRLLLRVRETIHTAPNEVRKKMNGFVIALGSYVAPLTELAVQTAGQIGKVSVDVGETDRQIPAASDYIKKIADRGGIGKKRKTAKC